MKQKLLFAFTILSCFAYAQTTFSPKVVINPTTGDAPYAIASGLIDGDTSPDILIGTNLGNTMEWYKNDDDGTFSIQTLIVNTLSGIGGLKLVDLNADGFLDILATAYNNDVMAWYPNDGLGNFVTENIISNSIDGASGLDVGDINK